jgi:hypothetical protein
MPSSTVAKAIPTFENDSGDVFRDHVLQQPELGAISLGEAATDFLAGESASKGILIDFVAGSAQVLNELPADLADEMAGELETVGTPFPTAEIFSTNTTNRSTLDWLAYRKSFAINSTGSGVAGISDILEPKTASKSLITLINDIEKGGACTQLLIVQAPGADELLSVAEGGFVVASVETPGTPSSMDVWLANGPGETFTGSKCLVSRNPSTATPAEFNL